MTSSSPLKTTETTTSISDVYGNVDSVLVVTKTSGGTEVHRLLTQNTYADNTETYTPTAPLSNLPKWHLGRLEASCVEHDLAGSAPQFRASAFQYHQDTGLLIAEHSGAEMDGCLSGFESAALSNALLSVSYTRDEAGNRESTVQKFWDGFSDKTQFPIGVEYRATRTIYDTAGRYPLRSEVHDHQNASLAPVVDPSVTAGWRVAEEILQRDVYGNVEVSVDELQNTFHTVYRPSGKPLASWVPFGELTASMTVAGNLGGLCPVDTAYGDVAVTRTGGYGATCYDMLGREIRSLSRGFDPTPADGTPNFATGPVVSSDTRYDYQSRPVAVSEPYFSTAIPRNIGSGSQCDVDPLGTFGDPTCLADPLYTRTIHDDIGRVTDVYMPFFQEGGSDGLTRLADSHRSVRHEGLITTTTDEQDFTTKVYRDLLGRKVIEEAETTGKTDYMYDSLGQLKTVDGPIDNDTIVIEYDRLGNKLWMTDPDKGDWAYIHNGLGELVCQVDARGLATLHRRDSLGRTTDRWDGATQSPGSEHCGDIGTLGAETRTQWEFHRPGGPGAGGSSPGQLTGSIITYAIQHQLDLPGVAVNPLNGFAVSTTPEYDNLGRVQKSTRIIGSGGPQYESFTYFDRYGRPLAQRDATEEGRGERFIYSDSGHVWTVHTATSNLPASPTDPGQFLRRVDRMNARGDVIHSVWGNGAVVERLYNPATGSIQLATDLVNDGYAIFYQYQWDRLGNLTRRTNLAHRVEEEHFFYDSETGRRLEAVWHGDDSASSMPHPIAGGTGWTLTQSMRYDWSGNIRCKSAGGSTLCHDGAAENYTYGGAGPHAVTGLLQDNASFTYNPNGDMESRSVDGDVTEFGYSAASRLEVVCSSPGGPLTNCTIFAYGEARQRVAKWKYEGSSSLLQLTHYVGGIEFEYGVESPAQLSDYRLARRPFAGVGLETVTNYGTSTTGQIRYQHHDSLGSIVAISNSSGIVGVQRMAFDAWGQRRNPFGDDVWSQWWANPMPGWAVPMTDLTPRGFTGHEHLDRHGLIHMNGRVYDPRLGRFLQADPFVEDTGTLNRYTAISGSRKALIARSA
ncbi:hypothetical protein HFP89_02005 [Wenzhouxiangella sp. XN79A]|uniref:RHS repeat-associated core domain-containing protein n=1 Tax=Wenzhouxiangella sp. XN79A TaxID=2724193 RepID=UPI00144AC620|nr:hypothetical protein [Wenzhouxiangella sp. XN79A]